jgi:hypothetical protein
VRYRRAFALVVAALASLRCASEYGGEVTARPDASPMDSAPSEEASIEVPEAASPDADAASEADVYDPCDKDKDGYRAMSCGGGDCDDDDRRAHPDQGFLSDTPVAPTNGNWDCTGVVDKQTGVNGGLCSSRSSTTCSGNNGRFAGDPACGATDTIQICSWNGSSCTILTTITSQKQGCK